MHDYRKFSCPFTGYAGEQKILELQTWSNGWHRTSGSMKHLIGPLIHRRLDDWIFAWVMNGGRLFELVIRESFSWNFPVSICAKFDSLTHSHAFVHRLVCHGDVIKEQLNSLFIFLFVFRMWNLDSEIQGRPYIDDVSEQDAEDNMWT
jgi:hypothetical protein